jgi:Zn-dependent M32 family carboxypeptidase
LGITYKSNTDGADIADSQRDCAEKGYADRRGNIMGIREDYQALIEKQLNEWKAQTERFKSSAEQIEAHAKVQYEKNLEALRAAQAQAWENFYKLKGANEGAWEQMKAHMDKVGEEVKSAVDRMRTNFKP